VSLPEDVRRAAAELVAGARWVRVEVDAVGALPEPPAPPPPPVEDPEAQVVLLLCRAAIAFGAGWWDELRARPGLDVGQTLEALLAEHTVIHGPWTAAGLRALRADALAVVLGQPRDHELLALQAQALRALGRWLAGRPVAQALAAAADGSAERLAAALAAETGAFADPGFAARAQRAAADLAGALGLEGAERLTASADAALPTALRALGVLVLDGRLAGLVDAGRPLRPGPQERELRAGAVHACELLAAREDLPAREVAARVLAAARGVQGAPPAYRCRTVAY